MLDMLLFVIDNIKIIVELLIDERVPRL